MMHDTTYCINNFEASTLPNFNIRCTSLHRFHISGNIKKCLELNCMIQLIRQGRIYELELDWADLELVEFSEDIIE